MFGKSLICRYTINIKVHYITKKNAPGKHIFKLKTLYFEGQKLTYFLPNKVYVNLVYSFNGDILKLDLTDGV